MNYQNQSYGEVAAQGAGAQYPAEPPRLPRFTGATNHLEEMLKGLSEFTTRLHRAADRLGGPIPEPAEKTGSSLAGARSDSAGRLEQVAESYSVMMRRLMSAVERIETL